MTDIEITPAPRVMLSITDAARCLSVGRSTMYELINRSRSPTASKRRPGRPLDGSWTSTRATP